MPRHNPAEAWPQQEPQDEAKKHEDSSDETKEALQTMKDLKDAPTDETKEALEMVRELNETYEDAKMQREREEASAAATAEIRKTIADRREASAEQDKAAMERLRRNMGASVLQELPPEDVKLEDGGWSEDAERALGPRKKAEPPPIPADAKKKAPVAKKPWYKRLFGSKE